jgi:ligand-binding sensor domain-containing protein
MTDGLYRRKRSRWKKVLEGTIQALLADETGVLWCGTADGLYTIQGDKPCRVQAELPAQSVQALCITAAAIWVGTTAGLCRIQGILTQIWDIHNSGLAGQNVRALAMMDDDLWVGTSAGLCRFKISAAESARAIG